MVAAIILGYALLAQIVKVWFVRAGDVGARRF